MRVLFAVVLVAPLVGVARADEAPPDNLPRVKVTLQSAEGPLEVGVEHRDNFGSRFDVVCQTPCAVSVPIRTATGANLQIRAPRSPGAALAVDPLALDGQRVTVAPPARRSIRAGAALLGVGIATSIVGGFLIPYGHDLAARNDLNGDGGTGGAVVTFGAGVASTVAGAVILATSRPKIKKIQAAIDLAPLTPQVSANTMSGRWPNGS
jgi:hypothetical protein